jgi:hypothetical protein
MHLYRSSIFLSTYIYLTIVIIVSCESTDDRNSKHFSLFSVVTFQNTECTSSASLSGGATDGTCYTNTECSDKGGTVSGNCASGFGVCCVFLNVASASSTITENRTRIRNSEFPSTDVSTANGVLVYTINKVSSDICQLRLDFTTFVIAGPVNSGESITTILGTHCTADSLQIITSDSATWSQTPTASLCGALTGEHVYVDWSATSTDTATLTLALSPVTVAAAVALRSWDIKTSQIECYASYRAPIGCQRYMTEDTGKIISYNFYRVTGAPAQGTSLQNSGLELALQRINTCIRRSKNMCCVEYKLCGAYNSIALTDAATGANIAAAANEGDNGVWNEAWSIDTTLFPFEEDTEQANIGMVDSQCTGDYVEIQSSWSAACGAGTSSMRTMINTRYCGARFGYNADGGAAISASSPVCDCSEPFIVRHSTDDANDLAGMNGLNTANTGKGLGRGFCLDYQQIPCWQ